jgi:hypothetical protein
MSRIVSWRTVAWGVVFSLAIAVVAQARADRNTLLPHAGARPAGSIMPKLIRVEGRLGYDDGIGPHIPEFGVWVGPYLRAGDHWYGLDLGKDKELLEAAKRLCGKQVVVEGIPQVRTLPGLIQHTIDVIIVTRLKAAHEWDHKAVSVQGKLTKKLLFIPHIPDRYLGVQWELTVGGKTYVLDLPHNEQLWDRAETLAGQRVLVTGYLGKDGQLVVTGLMGISVIEQIQVPVELAR